MKQLNCLMMIFFLLCITMQAQEVITVAGDQAETSSFSAIWTVGEGFIETLEGSDYIITQGLLQASLTITAINELTGLEYDINAFPNPTIKNVTLTVKGDAPKKLEYILFDMTGKMISKENFEGNETTIPFENLLPSTYILKVMENNKEVKNFKIVKQ